METIAEWPREFARVISCTKCTAATDPNLLRDKSENVPQPGYIGRRYRNTGLLLVGQNPAVPPAHLSAEDLPYTSALRTLQRESTTQNYVDLHAVLQEFIPKWPMYGKYFPLDECGLTVDDFAFVNLVRCRRTGKNSPPTRAIATNCTDEHFRRWVKLLSPKVVVFIGKWANDRVRAQGAISNIPCAFVNMQRSLADSERLANRAEVVALVRKHCRR
jgi:hypothetical protein